MTEVEVTDPTHPLFQRRFKIFSVSSAPQSLGHVLVTYREYMTLRIPLCATNLVPPRPTSQTKLTLEAVSELISLAKQCEGVCPLDPSTSGHNCHQNSNVKSSTTSHRSSKR